MIEVTGLGVDIGGKAVLEDVGFSVAPGDSAVLVGPSGAGKTTVLRVIAGLLRPSRGMVRLGGRVVSSPDTMIAPGERDIGFVFQRPALWPHMRVAANIGFGIDARRHPSSRQRVASLLEAVGMSALSDRFPDELSAGQAKRVELLRAIANSPAYLLLDEPFDNLDARSRDRALDLIERHVAATRPAVVVVSHNPAEVAGLGGQRYHLADGRLRPGD